MEFFNITKITRSNYFSGGNYPLNSLFQIIILSDEENKVSDIKGNIIPTQNMDGIQMPTEFTTEGWIFDPQEGQIIQGKYIFGDEPSVNKEKLKFLFGDEPIIQPKTELDESTIIVIIISVIAIAAAIFFLKGYKK